MIRYEANFDGGVEAGEPYTSFPEAQVFCHILKELNWEPKKIKEGRGGYFLFETTINKKATKLNVYLKKLTFGGRDNRPFEKRAQFSAALDRVGFKEDVPGKEYSLILALYKREEYNDTIICAWDIKDWGYNVGRAFNCFVDIRSVADALRYGFAQHKTSIGQIACCFKPNWFLYYLENKDSLHKQLIDPELLINKQNIKLEINDQIPNFVNLFQIVIDVLRSHDGIISIDNMEAEAANILELTADARQLIHNLNEGFRTELGYQLAWARNYLKHAGLIENPKRSIWGLTELGFNTFIVNVNEIKQAATEKEIKADISNDIINDIEAEDDIEIEKDFESDEIEHPFDPNLVDIKTRTMSLDLILKRLRRDEIDLNTSFQRKAGLWDVTKQSRLIESILVKFPLPAFYFDGSDDNNWLVVDGLQRLSSLDNFVNKEAFGLQKMEFLSQFNGKKFRELPGFLQRRIEEFEITAYVIAQGTPKVLKFNVFKRINTGGLTLTSQEIRNALNQGEPAIFIKRLADLRFFKLATAFSISEDRMLDREFVTRFFAFYIFPIEEYKSDLDSFLNSGMEMIYKMGKDQLDDIADRFNKAMLTAIKIFGDDAFRKRYRKSDKRKPINKALFEVWSVLFSRLSKPETDLLIKRKLTLRDKFVELLNENEDFNLAISSGTGDRSKVRKRFDEINRIIQSTLSP